MDLLARRADYPILATSTYLANHTLGAMHRSSKDRLAEYTELWATEGVVSWNTWAPEMARVADLVGAVIGAEPGSTVIRANVADALATVMSCVPFVGPRTEVVYADALEWPGSNYLLGAQTRRGATVTRVPVSGDGVNVDLGPLVDAITERTAVVYLSLVLFRTSTLVDPRPVIARAHEVGALVILDAYQAAGAVPVDAAAIGADVVVGGSVKYLCGGPGAGWVSVRPHVAAQLVPADSGWFGHARPFDFAFGPFEPADGVQRFAGGTPNVPAAYAASPGYQAVLDVGIATVRARSLELTQRLVEAVLENGWTLRSPVDGAHRGGHVTFDPGNSLAVHDALVARRIVVDHRPGAGLRVGPHFFTTDDEITAVVEAVKALAPR